MKNKKLFNITAFLLAAFVFGSCTKLDETLYDKVDYNGFLATKQNVYSMFLKSFDQGYFSIANNVFQMQENPADQFMTPNREGRWLDGGTYYRLHYHTWTPQESYISGAWNDIYLGVMQANNSIEIIQTLDIAKFSITAAEQKEMIAELRTLRAWNYLRLLDLYRNVPLITKYKGQTAAELSAGVPQSTPQQTYDFIESELKSAINDLYTKGDAGTSNFQGRWTKGSAMSLLVRLYLNAKVYIGQEKFKECANVAQDIINGKYGSYAIESKWDGIYDWDNDKSAESIYAFPSTFAYSRWQYTSGMYWWMSPFKAAPYFEFTDFIDTNPKQSLQPSKDADGKEYTFDLGKPFSKYQKYSDDIRVKVYKNLGSSKREGMFLYGYLTYNGNKDTVKSSTGYPLYIRDQVGIYYKTVGGKLITLGPGELTTNKKSDMTSADQNSGVYMTKYPMYPSNDAHKMEADYVEIRLAEIYYSLAECKFREGDKATASVLLNNVRKRYYATNSPSLYKTDGSQLTELELMDEWGREFLGEGRRRVDLIRFGKFNSGIWWDKSPDADNTRSIFPIGQSVLNVSSLIKQNPGY